MWAARSVALQGIGGPAMQVALQGFFDTVQVEEPEMVYAPFGGGGRSWEAQRRRRQRREDEDLLLGLLGR